MELTYFGPGISAGEAQNAAMYGNLFAGRRSIVPQAQANATNIGPGGTSAIANTPGAIPGLPARAYDPATGGIPQVPLPATTQADAIAANLKNLQALLDYSAQINAFNLAQQRKQYEASFPNYAGTEAQISKNIAAGARGELSPGTMRNLANAAAERAIARGMPIDAGGPTVGNMNYLNLLGTSTEQLQQNAINQLGAYNALSPRTALFNPASFAVTPEAQYNAALQASIFNAAPVPSAALQAALDAARAGANFGYGGARAPGISGGYQAPSTSANLMDIFNRYAPTAKLNPNQIQQNQTIPYSRPTTPLVAPFDYSTLPSVGYNQQFGPLMNQSTVPSVYNPASTYSPSFDYSQLPGVPNPSITDFNYNTIPTQLYPQNSPSVNPPYYLPTGNDTFDEILWNVENAY